LAEIDIVTCFLRQSNAESKYCM